MASAAAISLGKANFEQKHDDEVAFVELVMAPRADYAMVDYTMQQ